MNNLFRSLLRGSILLAVLGASSLAAEPAPPSAAALDLTPWRGRVVLVDFWASWCAPCRESFPWMGRMLARYGERGLTIVAVNLDQDPQAARVFLESAPSGFHHLSDPEGRIPEEFGITVMPSALLFDREGKPTHRHEGFDPLRADEYEARIVALIEGRGDANREELSLTARRRYGLGVRPWQRGLLAAEAMLLDADALDLAIDDHIYFSKEASSGGRGFGGGGCGCN
jgi:thiol-disulfide isomerase/thioredoxin